MHEEVEHQARKRSGTDGALDDVGRRIDVFKPACASRREQFPAVHRGNLQMQRIELLERSFVGTFCEPIDGFLADVIRNMLEALARVALDSRQLQNPCRQVLAGQGRDAENGKGNSDGKQLHLFLLQSPPISLGASPALNLLDDFQKAFERRLRGVQLALRVAPVSLERERLLVAVLEQRADLPQVVELTLADRGPFHFTGSVVAVVAKMDVKDTRRVEPAVAAGEWLLARFGRIIGVPGETD